MISDIIISLVFASALYFYIYEYTEPYKFFETLKNLNSLLIGVWATILGFLITAVSILLSVKDSKYIIALKNSGHFKTLLKIFVFTCYMAGFILAFSILFFILPHICMIFWWVYVFFTILCLKRIFTCLEILLKIINLIED